MKYILALMGLALAIGGAAAQTSKDPAPVALVCAYNTSPPAPTAGQFYFVQCTSDGKLITSGSGGSTSIVSGTTPCTGGNDKAVWFNDGGTANCASTTLTFDKTTNTLTVGGSGTLSASSLVSSPQLSIAGNSSVFVSGGTGIIAQRSGATAQGSQVYNTYTNGTNNEYGTFDWVTTPGTLTIGTKAGSGGGTVRGINIDVGAVTALSFNMAGNVATFNSTVSAQILRVANINSQNNSVTAMMIANTTGDVTFSRAIIAPAAGWLRTTGTTVAALPSAATAGAGARAFVTDATACTLGGALTGGGSTPCPVYSTGSAWLGG